MTLSPRLSVVLVLMLWFAGLGAAMQFAKMSLVFADLEILYGGTGNPWLGFLVSLISFFGIVFGLAAGLIVARYGFRRMLIWGLALGALVSLLQAMLPPLEVMMGSRLIEGVSHLVIVVAAPTLISQKTTARFLPLAMTLWSTFFGVAYAITGWFGNGFIGAFGVPGVFLAHSGMLALTAGGLFLLLPSDPRKFAQTSANMFRQHFEIYADPAKAAPALAWFFYTLTFVSLLTVLPPYIAESDRAFTVGMMPLAGIVASMSFGVLLQRIWSPVAVTVLGFALSGVFCIGLFFGPGNPILCIALFATLGLIQGANFSSIPFLNNTAESRAHAQGAVAQMGNFGNTIGTPIALALVNFIGVNGLILFGILAYGGGILAHVGLARLRSR